MRKRTALAQVLALDPDIILMDEPFSALDIQTRQLMENEVLALWAAKRKAVLFITHDLDEAIALSDRVVVLSAGPATRTIGESEIDLPRPRDVAEQRVHPRAIELHAHIWAVLREEVLKAYTQQLNKATGVGRILNTLKPSAANLRVWQVAVLVLVLLAWQWASRDQQVAFFIGEPIQVLGRLWSWFLPFGQGASMPFPERLAGRANIYPHLGITLLETVLAFGIGTALGLASGRWLALAPMASAILEPYVKAANSMPRVILAPIFGLWFGLGIWSNVAMAIKLVFFVVFFQCVPGR